MSKGGVSDPEKFELASIVTKNSRTGITSNRRLLVVKAGHLYYYSNIPKSFTGDNIKMLEQFHELPKCSIEILHINRVNGFEPGSSYFSIEFEAKHMLEREDIRRTLVNEDYNFTPRNTRELVTWQFTCDNQFIKQRWVSALLHLKDYYRNEQLNMQKYFEGIHEEPKSSNGSISSRSSLKISPWRESVASRKSYTLDNSKYGLELRDGSPKEAANKLEDPFLKKGRSEDQRTFNQYPEFEMIIQVEEPRGKPEDAFKVHQVKKDDPPKPQPSPSIKPAINPPPPSIEEVVEQPSIMQTPLKEDSYSDSEPHTERRASMEKTLNDLKLFSETHKLEYESPRFDYPPEIPEAIVPPLEIVEERHELKSSKISADNSFTPRSNLETKSEEATIEREAERERSRIRERQRQEERDSISSRQKPPGCDFQWLFGESCRAASKFDCRLERQKELISLYESFKAEATAALAEWIDSKGRGESRYRTSEQPNHGKVVEVGSVELRVAVPSTQTILINNRPRLFFNEDPLKNLKREFKVYQCLARMLMRRLKHDSALNLRVPLAVYLEYKGVCCIAFSRVEGREGVSLQGEEWALERSVLQEEGFRSEWFNFSTIGGFLSLQVRVRGKGVERDEEGVKEHLKRMCRAAGPEKNHNIVFDSPIDRAFLDCARKENASTSLESMEKYVKGLRAAKGLQGSCPKEEIITALENCLFCKHLRRVYRSAQGEIDETHFFNLVFKGDAAMAPLLEQASCPSPPRLTGQLFSFIEHYFGATLEVDEKAVLASTATPNASPRKQKDIFFACSVVPIVREYPFGELELVESFGKLAQYLQGRHPLAEAALTRKKEVYHLRGELPLALTLELLYDEACFHYCEGDFIGCIRKCRDYEEACPQKYTRLFAVYLLMMKAYSEFSETDFTLALRSATELIEYNYGLGHSSLAALYSLAAYYYAKLAQSNPQRESALTSAAAALLRQAEQLCLKHFGTASKQYLDVLLDLSRLHRRTDPPTALRFLARAKQTTEQNLFLATPENVVSLQAFEAELALQSGDFPLAESSLLNALSLVSGKVSAATRKHLAKLQYELGFYQEKMQYCRQAVEKVWEMGERAEAVEMAYRAAVRTSGEGEGLVDEDDSMRFEGRERALLEVEKERNEHGGLVEMVTAAIDAKNVKLLTMIYFLSRV